jgi:hypothetical protein
MGREISLAQSQLPVEEVKAQVESIQKLMGSLMRNGEHYGKIPGCGDKPSLLKAGAEKLGFMFRLAPDFTVTGKELPNGHREYEVVCRLTHIDSKNFVGTGIGLASTMESKYRYRNSRKEVNTGKPVPKEYWDNNKDQKYLGGNGYQARKIDSQWMIVRVEDVGKAENPDIADVYNTVLKIAKKRAHVDAIITVTAASDIFIQDVEDLIPEQPQPGQSSAGKTKPDHESRLKEKPPEGKPDQGTKGV